MQVLLVNPPWPYHAFRHPSSRFTPPLGPASVAAVLEQAGLQPEIVDMAVQNLPPKDIGRYLRRGPGLVGLSLNMSITECTALETARAVKELAPEATVVLGGNHATFEYRNLLSSPHVDAVCLREAEPTIVEVARRLERGESLAGCPGVAARDGDHGVVVGPAPRPVEDLDSLPFPARHLLPMHLYGPDQRGQVGSVRGCPFGCLFCSAGAFWGTKVRAQSLRRTMEEIELVVSRYGTNKVLFSDDTFVLHPRRLKEFCRLLDSSGLGVKWVCNTRADNMTPETARMMKESGCEGILVGIESATQAVLDRATKRLKVEQAREAVRAAKAAGLIVWATFIVGLPGETPESLEASVEFIRAERPQRVTVSMLTPFPGTPIRERARELGISILSHDYSRYEMCGPLCETDTMPVDDAKRGYIKMLLAVSENQQ